MVNKHILAAGSGFFASLPLTLVRAPFSYITTPITWLFKAILSKRYV